MKRSDVALVIIIVCGIIGFLATPILLRMSTSEKFFAGVYSISRNGKEISDIEIKVQVQGGDINIFELSEDSPDIIEVDWDITHTGLYIPEISLMTSYSIIGSVIKINIYCLVDEIHLESLNLNIYFNPSYMQYSFLFNTGMSNLVFDISDIDLKQFEFISSSGSLNFKLNNSYVDNNFKVVSDSGN